MHTERILIVLPHRFNARAKQIVVTSSAEARGRNNVVIQSPEVFDSLKSEDLFHIIAPV